jgi:hypothetical protein
MTHEWREPDTHHAGNGGAAHASPHALDDRDETRPASALN